MQPLIDVIVSGDLNTTTLLLLFILGILTKRFVPWWVHEEALEKLEQYEQSAPELLDEIGTLIDILNDPKVSKALEEESPEVQDLDVQTKSEELRRVVRRHRKRSGRNRKGGLGTK